MNKIAIIIIAIIIIAIIIIGFSGIYSGIDTSSNDLTNNVVVGKTIDINLSDGVGVDSSP